MSFAEMRTVVFQYRKMILWLCLSAVLNAVLLAYLVPEKYKATALVLVRPQENIGLAPHDPASKEVLNLPASGSMPVETPSKTYIEVIKSRAVAEKVVRMLALDTPKKGPAQGYYGQLWEDAKDEAKRIVTASLEILQYGRTFDADPFETAVRRLMKNISLAALKNTYVFEISYLAPDPEEAAAVANTAATMFVEYSSLANEREAKTGREFAEQQLVKVERELADARQARLEYQKAHQSVAFKEERTEQIKLVSDLEASLEKIEVELSGLLSRFTPRNPRVLRLQTERKRLLAGIAERKERLGSLPDRESRLASLDLEVRTSEATYEVLKREYDEARIRESKKMSEIRIVSPAVVPVFPSRPIKIQYAGVALVLALVTGIGLAFLLGLNNARLMTVTGAEQGLQLKVLATIPDIRQS
jgi:uncharacterized protein involved in exopolysaccharide biosynthesis